MTGASRNFRAVLISVSLISQPLLCVVLSVSYVVVKCAMGWLGLVGSRRIFSTPLFRTGKASMVPWCILMTQDRRGGPSLRSDWSIAEPECTPQVGNWDGASLPRQSPELSVAEYTPPRQNSLDGFCPMPPPWPWVPVQSFLSYSGRRLSGCLCTGISSPCLQCIIWT